jgi:hypothetical protein
MTIFTALVATLLLTSSGSDHEREHEHEHECESATDKQPVPTEASPGHEVPPGSPAEVEVWERGVNVTRLLHATRDRATRLQHRAKGKGTIAELERLSKSDDPRKQAAQAAHGRILTAGRAVVAMLKRQWPVDPVRGCSTAVMDYESQLWNQKKATRELYLPPAQKTLSICIARADSVIKVMNQANAELEAAIVAGEGLVGIGVDAASGKPAAGETGK